MAFLAGKAGRMPKIFISYRRADSAYVAAILREKLEEEFGAGSVFLDVDNIPFGFDFRKQINSAVGQCDVLLALIGNTWIGAAGDDGIRRIDSPTDSVRFELEAALS